MSVVDACGTSTGDLKLRADGGADTDWSAAPIETGYACVLACNVTPCNPSVAGACDLSPNPTDIIQGDEKWETWGAGANCNRHASAAIWSAHPVTYSAVSYPPPCGDPQDCAPGGTVCSGGTPACGCFSTHYNYHTWGCT